MITIGAITMNSFGWFALLAEIVIICLKDYSTWICQATYREGIPRRRGILIVGVIYTCVDILSEILGVLGQRQYAMISGLFLVISVSLITTNGVEMMGRQTIYWIACNMCFMPIALLLHFPSLVVSGSISYYQSPERVLPNMGVLIAAYVLFCCVWHSRLIHIVPAGICTAFCWIGIIGSGLAMGNMDGDMPVTLQHTAFIMVIYMLICAAYLMILFVHHQRRQRRLTMEEQCRRRFYDRITAVKQQAGAFRHDLANHLQVMRTYGEDGWQEEQEQYLARLSERQEQLQVEQISGEPELDFMLQQLRLMAEEHDISLTFDWQTGAVSQECKIQIVQEALDWLSQIYHHKRRSYVIVIGEHASLEAKRVSYVHVC